MNSQSTIPVSDEIWNILREVSTNQKETDKQLKGLSADLSASQKELSASQKELSASQKETDKQLKELSADLSASQKETNRQLQKIGGRFNERWGALVESLVEGSLVKILQDRGIDIMQTHTRSEALWRKPDGHIQKREFDIIVANGTEVVVVEVKTTLHSKDVKRFLETLQDFKKYFPRYKLETIYGAVAYLTSENKSHLLAEEEGLFVIRATGDSASIINTADFKPKSFGQTGGEIA